MSSTKTLTLMFALAVVFPAAAEEPREASNKPGGTLWEVGEDEIPAFISGVHPIGKRLIVSGQAEPLRVSIHSVDLDSGKILWQKPEKDFPEGWLGGLEVHDNRVFMGFMQGRKQMFRLAALDLETAKVLWFKKPEEVAGRIQVLQMAGDRLLAWGPAEPDEVFLGCYKPESGEVLWDLPPTALPGWIRDKGLSHGRLVLGGIGDGKTWILGFDPDSGKLRWEVGDEGFPKGAFELRVCPRVVCVGGGDERKKGWMKTFDSLEGKPLWEKKSGELPGAVYVLAADETRLIAGGVTSDQKVWVGCYEQQSGKVLWEKKPGEVPGTWISIVKWNAGKAFLRSSASAGPGLNGDDHFVCLRGDTGQLAWSRQTGDFPGHIGIPSFIGNRIVVGGECEGQGWLGCWSADTGKIEWEKKPGELPGRLEAGTPQVCGDRVVVAGRTARQRGWIKCFRIGGKVEGAK